MKSFYFFSEPEVVEVIEVDESETLFQESQPAVDWTLETESERSEKDESEEEEEEAYPVDDNSQYYHSRIQEYFLKKQNFNSFFNSFQLTWYQIVASNLYTTY